MLLLLLLLLLLMLALRREANTTTTWYKNPTQEFSCSRHEPTLASTAQGTRLEAEESKSPSQASGEEFRRPQLLGSGRPNNQGTNPFAITAVSVP